MAAPAHDAGAGPDRATRPRPVDRIRSRPLELALTAILCALAAAYLVRFVWAMAHAPLWGDEIWSVLNFSSQGPRTSLTEVNNAILPTFISSILPGSDSFDPVRARFISMIVVVATPVLLGYELFRRRWFLAGGLLVFLFSVNFQWLDRTLQARGYGVLGFCATAASLWVWRYLDDRRTRWLVGMAVVTVVGIWTVPSFTFFAVPFWLLVLATDRRARVLWAGLAAAGVVALVYAPLVTQLADQTAGYSEAFGNQFSSPVAVAATIGTYLLDLNRNPILVLAWALAVLAPALVLLPADPARGPASGLRRRLAVDVPQSIRQLVRILAGGSIGLFAIALILTTPPQRTVGFVVVPIAVATVVALTALRDDPRLGDAASTFLVVVAALAVIHGVAVHATFSYLTIQDWSGAAGYITETFPDDTPVYAVVQPAWLAAYLDDEDYRVTGNPDAELVRDGQAVASDFDSTGRERDKSRALHEIPGLVTMTLPQRGAGDRGHGYGDPPLPFPLLFAPPLEPTIAEIAVDGAPAPELVDRDLDTGTELGSSAEIEVTLPPDTIARSLVLALGPRGDGADGGGEDLDVSVEVTAPDGTTTTLPGSDVRRSPSLVTVRLGDRPIESIRLLLSPSSADEVDAVEAWVYRP